MMRGVLVLLARWPVSPLTGQRPPSKRSADERRRFSGARANGQTGKQRAFTLIELLVVISIIAILAAAIVPNYIGFDKEAKVVTTRSNLDTLRSRITMYRAKEGRYPETLTDLIRETYLDAGVKRPYLKKIPKEMLSNKKGNNKVTVQTSEEPLNNQGGWVYVTDTADVIVNLNEPLGRKWGDHADQIPSDW